MKTKIKILIVSCVIAAAAVTGFNMAQNSNNMDVTLADIAVMARADDPEDPPGAWDATYPPCENQIIIGFPPLQYVITIQGTYRECVSGEGVCLYNDGTCCANRVFGICVL